MFRKEGGLVILGRGQVEQLLDRECEAQIQRLLTSSQEMQQKLRDKAGEAKGLLMQKPNRDAENQLNALVAGIC